MTDNTQSWMKSAALNIDAPDGTYQHLIVPFYNRVPIEYFSGTNGLSIAYKAFIQPYSSRALIIVNGRTETFLKYQELIYEFYNLGYSVYAYDHRGQGYSARPMDNPELGDIDNIDFYTDDLVIFVDTIVQDNHQDYSIIGHSMGGAVLIDYLANRPHPINQAILSAPMIEPRVLNRPFTYFSRHVTLPISRFKNNYVLTTGPFKVKDENTPSSLQHFSERTRLIRRIYHEEPELRMGGPSRRWLYQWTKNMRKLQKMAESINTPTLLLKAEIEATVNNKAIDAFAKRFEYTNNTPLTFVTVSGSRHELFHESDPYRDIALNTIWTFLNQTRY